MSLKRVEEQTIMLEKPKIAVWLDGASHPREQVGGKGQSLSRLVSVGAPVPPAFCVTTDAYRSVAKELWLPTRIDDVHESDLPTIREVISSSALPAEIRSQLDEHFQTLSLRSRGPLSVAVRSSATVEDSANLSFAGLHETVLDVRDLPSLERAVKQCWSSLWTERAVAYRRQSGVDSGESAIAVVVQELVRSDISVIVFTTDPMTRRSDRLVINATWGLGESLVSGQVTPDHIVVDEYGDVVEYAIGSKAMMVVPGAADAGGTREMHVPRLLRNMRTLSNDQASSIAASGRWLANRMGFATDLEGGIADDQFHIFQARPITTLGNLSPFSRQIAA